MEWNEVAKRDHFYINIEYRILIIMNRMVKDLQGREKVMALLTSENKKIVEAALCACSRLLINKWEDLE